MNKVKLNDIVKDGNIVIPLYLFKLYKSYNLTLEEFIMLMYLYNKNGNTFDPTIIATDLNIDLMEVMGYVSVLTDKGLITLDINKSEGGMIEEKINLNNFYEKISLSLINQFNTKEVSDESIYQIIEAEFNRKLTPMECDVIKEWQDNNYSDSLIKEAVKEASLNGVNSLRYIDKILFEWNKRGVKSKDDLKNNEEVKENIEIFNCDWLDEDDE